MAICEKKFYRKSSKYFRIPADFLLNFFSNLTIFCTTQDRKTFAQVPNKVAQN